MNILDLSEKRQQEISDRMDLDLIEMKNKVSTDLINSKINNEDIQVKDDTDFRFLNELAVFIY
jgi:hypothetical protein